jgi:hypothetical protein
MTVLSRREDASVTYSCACRSLGRFCRDLFDRAQSLTSAVWHGQRGSLLKVLAVDPATGSFAGVFVSSPVGPCPAVPYDVVGRIRPGGSGSRTPAQSVASHLAELDDHTE